MATTVYLQKPDTPGDSTPPGDLSGDDDKFAQLGTAFSASGVGTLTTVTGPTSGVQVGRTSTIKVSWFTNQLAAVTISGTVTLNVWMSESNMSANAGSQVIIDRCDSAGSFISTIVNSEKGTELPVGTRAAQNWTASPTSTTLANGDRIRIQVYANDAGGTMASGFTCDFSSGGGTGGSDGDTFVTFTETIAEFVPPAGYAYPKLTVRNNRRILL